MKKCLKYPALLIYTALSFSSTNIYAGNIQEFFLGVNSNLVDKAEELPPHQGKERAVMNTVWKNMKKKCMTLLLMQL